MDKQSPATPHIHWYRLQNSPYIILYGITVASDLLAYLHQKSNYRLCICLLLTLSLIIVYPSYRCDSMTKEQLKAWNHAYDILEQYSSDGEILVSMLLSDYCLEHEIATSNYGQAEYNNMQNLENYKDNKLWRNIFLFDYTEDLLQQNISYNQTVKDKIYAQSYHCIALVYAGEYHLAEDDFINAGYHAIASEELVSGTQCWYTVFYAVND